MPQLRITDLIFLTAITGSGFGLFARSKPTINTLIYLLTFIALLGWGTYWGLRKANTTQMYDGLLRIALIVGSALEPLIMLLLIFFGSLTIFMFIISLMALGLTLLSKCDSTLTVGAFKISAGLLVLAGINYSIHCWINSLYSRCGIRNSR